MATNRKRTIKKKTFKPKPPAKKNGKNNGFWKFIISFYGALSVIGVLAGIVISGCWIYDKVKSPHRHFIEENYITGISAPFFANNTLSISTGGGDTFTEYIPPNGIIDVQTPTTGVTDNAGDTDGEFSYKLKITNHTFLLSIVIKDFKTGEIIADIEDNAWALKKTGITDYSDNNLLEVLDNYGYVAFSMWIDDKGIYK